MLGTPGQRKYGGSAPVIRLVMPGRARPVLGGLHRALTEPAPTGGRVDGEQPDVGAVVARDRGDDAGCGSPEDDRGLVGGEERAVELLGGRRISHGPGAQLRQGGEVGAVERGRRC